MSTTHLFLDPCPPVKLQFLDIISKRTAYGLIWTGKYLHKDVVIKMIMLTTGIHFDKNTGKWHDGEQRELSEEEASPYFKVSDVKPYSHIDFMHRRSMTPLAFGNEVKSLIGLSDKGLAPKVHGFGFNVEHPIHYAFIIMERVPSSIKDILLTRKLTKSETATVYNMIDYLHNKCGILHGDLKPSNMGCWLDKSCKRIIKVCFFDCQKVAQGDPKDEKFQARANREIDNFKKHWGGSGGPAAPHGPLAAGATHPLA
jgi:hypothetical protein